MSYNVCCARLVGALCLLAHFSLSAEVVFNEIMFHPAPAIPEDPRKEWVELFNSGTTNVDLTGWQLAKGVSFTFTNVTLPAGGYTVVAADLATFQAEYPGVTNVVGNWAGKLSNNGEKLELADASGQVAADVTYTPDGDWAVLRVGEMYPGQPTWWRGWGWTNVADGLGHSIELVNPALALNQGQNWTPSLTAGGTPGRANSVATNDIAPMILDVRHYPPVPKATDSVAVTARIVDEASSGLTVRLFSRVDGSGSFTSTPMFDDGAHGDGAAGDGYFGAVLPAQPDKMVVEFYVQATDATGHERTWPGPTDNAGTQAANALYQVDELTYTGSQPTYRLIITASEWSTWLNLMDTVSNGRYSDPAMNATLVRSDGLGTEVRYNVLVRNRGAGTRAAHPHNFRLDIPADRSLQGVTEVDLNTRTVHSQVAGNALFSLAGLPNAYGAPVQVRVNSANLANAQPTGTTDSFQFGSYYCFQSYSSDWASAHLPHDPQGNIYKGLWYEDQVQLTNGAVLDWRGSNVANYRMTYGPAGPISNTGAYSKQNNKSEDDWSDLINLCSVLNLTPSADYFQAVSQVVDIDEWLRYFAANSLLINMETTLGTGVGDDYSMYSGVNDPRFQLLNHDLDTVLGQGDASPSITRSIFKGAEIAALDRFLKNPDVAPRYFATLLDLADTAFAPANLNATLDQVLGGWVPESYIQNMKDVAATRRAAVLDQIPLSLSLTSLPAVVNGYPHTTSASTSLAGLANAVETRQVLVNGVQASYTPWQASWTASTVALKPGINRILIQTLNASGAEFARTNVDIWYDDGSVQTVGGTIAANSTWTAASGPYSVTTSLTVAANATLTIEPGTTIYLGSGVNFTVANGGKLLAEGTEIAPIRFTVTPGSGASWGHLVINGEVGSPESRISFAQLDANGSSPCIEVASGSIWLDHATFGNTARQYLALDGASFVVSHCVFPTATAAFELVHGTKGIKTGGRGIVRDCFFGAANGYNDVMDFTGGNRDFGQPIIEYYNNVFIGSGDDLLDLDGTDAWIEGNIFLHTHRNGAPDSSSAVSGGNTGSDTSEITMVRNLIFDCDQAATAKQGNFYTLLNNTIVHTTKEGGVDTEAAVVNLGDDGTTVGLGYYLEGNIIVDAEGLVRDYDNALSIVTFSNNLMPFVWTGPGGGNSTNAARLKYIPQNSETQFTTWEQAQVMWDWFSLQSGSPAHGTGPNHSDMGAAIPSGVTISGEPASPTSATNATLTVGTLITGHGLPTGGFPQGSGYTHYKYRLDDGAWNAETPIATPITLTGLANGPHRVEVVGRRDTGGYQDAAELGVDAAITTSRTWTVNTALNRVLLNELLADNRAAWFVGEDSPDVIELHNPDLLPVDLSGMGLTDDPTAPYKFTFPAGTLLNGGQFLVVVANGGTGTNLYAGFKLDKDGGFLALFDSQTHGGALLDSVSYGLQLTDYSIGRLPDGTWGLTQPTFGGRNVAAPTGGVQDLRLNEWLAASLIRDDFVELYNGDSLPVNLGGCYLSDVPDTLPARFQITPLSFIPAKSALDFIADGNAQNSPRHLNFNLAQEWGTLGLFAPDLTPLDRVLYGSQSAEISMGRTPNGGITLAFFPTPTPGSGNPGSTGDCTVSNVTVNLMDYTQVWKYNQTQNLDGVNWTATNYNDSAWPSGPGLLAYESNTAITPMIHTTLLAPGSPPAGLSAGHAYYFRTTLVVTNDLASFTLNARMRLDDCGVIYINGVEFFRPRMSSGTILNGTFGSGAVGANTDATADEYFTIPAARLVPGTNVIAVEVHQVNSGSSDIVWGLALDAVRSFTNCTSPTAVLNEVLANNRSYTNADGSVTDWVELINPSASPLSLTGMSLTDNPGNPRRWVFPAGAVLGGSNYLIVQFDSGSPASAVNGPSLNTGFGLSTAGGAVFLYDAGGAFLDGVNYGPQAADFSIARIPNATGPWVLALPTLGSANIAVVPGDVSAVRINEWAASVTGGPDWFELFNPNPQPVALGGLYLTDKLSNRTKHPIAPLSFIGVGSGAYATYVADNDTAQGADHVNFSLDAGGEALGLFAPGVATPIDSVSFGAQVAGVSEGRLPDGGDNRVFFAHPTPSEANWLPLTNVVINEVLTHTDPPLEDAIELRNLSDAPVNISGWWISDTKNAVNKFRIPSDTILAPHSYVVFYEYQFNPAPGVGSSFEFSSAYGDSAWLSACDTNGQFTGFRDHVSFGPQFNGVSFGRVPTSAGADFAALQLFSLGTSVTATSPTNQLSVFRTGAGAPNAAPRVGPVIISEIMYHPLVLGTNDNARDEFVELYNLTSSAVPLYDPYHSTNGWRLRGGVDFDFNNSHSLAPGGFLLLVSFDPATNATDVAAFRAAYGTNGTLVGPYTGRLDNAGESLELYAPDNPQTTPIDFGFVPYVLVERVAYSDLSPWPTNADGFGLSLQRLTLAAYGNDPTNWFAALPSAGFNAGGDTDGDGIPDAWEDAHGLNKFVNDAALDPDKDGFSNGQEYLAGTDPQQSTSALRVDSAAPNTGGTDIRFEAVAGRSYTILHTLSLLSGSWQRLTDVPPQATTHSVTIHDPAATTTNHFYRLVTPALP